jgi:hypothetical protein
MAAPAYATDLSDIITDMASSTGWTLISDGGGGANSFSVPETDDYIQGNNCISRNPWTAANIRGMVYNSSQTITADNAVFIWWKSDVAQALSTRASGGIQCLVGNATTALKCYYVDGSDTYARGGWKCSPIDPTTTQSTSIGSPTSTTSYFGVRWAVASSGPSKGFPYKIDAIRRGRNIEVTAGDSGTPATFESLTTYADDITRRWGIVQPTATGMTQQGRVYWGTASTAVYSRVSNRTLVLLDTLNFTVAGFTQILFANASSDVVWDNVSIGTLDTTNNRGLISISNNAVVSLTNCNISDLNTTTDGGTNSTWDGTTWRRCNAVTAAGGSFLGCNFLVPTVAANTSSLVWDIATNPNGLLDGSSFSAHASTLHHGIEFGLTSPTTIDLIGVTFTGFSSSNNVNNSMIHVKRTSGTVTINITGGGTTPSYRTDGATVNIVSNPVTFSITSQTAGGSAVVTNTFLQATSGTGLPVAQATTIVNSGTTATATTTGVHGLVTNDKVNIAGASHVANNGVFTVTVTGTNTFTYTMGSAPGSSPTGTITTSFVFLYGATNGSGFISASRALPGDFGVTGWARKGTSAPYYKQGSLSGTVLAASGGTFTAIMVPDE